jgi:hypothetical protein
MDCFNKQLTNKQKEDKKKIKETKIDIQIIKEQAKLNKQKKQAETQLNNDDKEGALIDHVIPDYILNSELINQMTEIMPLLFLIDRMYINVKSNKSILMIINGLYKNQFQLYTKIVVFLTLFIAILNLTFASLINIDIPNTAIIIGDILTGALGIIVATIASNKDKKDETTHLLLTAMNNCNEFLIECEKKIMSLIHLHLYKNAITDDDGKKITLDELREKYGEVIIECSNIINTFSSEEAKILMNGPLSMFKYICCCCCCFKEQRNLYDPEYMKLMIRHINSTDIEQIKQIKCDLINKDDLIIEDDIVELGISSNNI